MSQSLKPEARVVDGKTVFFYSPSQIEEIVKPTERLPKQSNEYCSAYSTGHKTQTHSSDKDIL